MSRWQIQQGIQLTMDNGKEVIGKVPNLNAGIPYYTTASEVATMDFAREVLHTPAPEVYAWDGQASTVGAEFIIMEKAQGVPLVQVWSKLQPNTKLKILRQVVDYQKKWATAEFGQFGSLYYTENMKTRGCEFYGLANNGRFCIGPAVGREWSDEGRLNAQCDRGPWDSIGAYRRAIAFHEIEAVKMFPHHVSKQLAQLYGPEPFYQPSPEKKLAALNDYLQIPDSLLLPNDPLLIRGYFWHDDLHDENVFVDPETLQITAIIDWQSTQVLPLFNHSLDPCFLDYTGPDVGDNLERPELPQSIKSLEGAEKAAALREFLDKGVMIAWRYLFRQQIPNHYPTFQFQRSIQGNLLFLCRHIFELGEAQFRAMLLDFQTECSLNRGTNSTVFPLKFSESQIATIEADMKAASLGIEVMNNIKQQLGHLWPDKGVIEEEYYEQAKQALRKIKKDIIDEYHTHIGWDTAIFEQLWPFDD